MTYISLIIASFNSEKHVNNCFKKSYIDNNEIEYLFVDDGSVDNSAKLAEDFALSHTNVRVIRKQHTGCTNTYQVGINESKGKFIFFLDVDDWIEKDVLLETLNIIKSNDKLDCVLFNYITDFPSGKKSFATSLNKFIKPNKITCVEEFKHIPLTRYFMNHNIMIKKAILFENGYVEPAAKLYGDCNMVLFALVNSKQIYFLDKVLYHYISGIPGQTTTFHNLTKNYQEYYKNLLSVNEYFNNDSISKISSKKRKLIYHTLFLYTCMSIFVTFVKYSKEKKINFINFRKQFKANSPKIYRHIFHRTIIVLSFFFPKIFITPVCKLIKKIISNQIPWEEKN